MPEVLNVALSDQLEVRNKNNELPETHFCHGKPIILDWNSRRVSIEAGGTAYVPFEVVKKDFGDPRSTDITVAIYPDGNRNAMPEFIPDRLTEARRLRQYYQSTEAEFREYIPGDRTFFEAGISDRAPKAEVYTRTGDRVYTVLDDPYGDRVIAAVSTRSDRAEMDNQLHQQQAAMQAQQEEMRRMQDEMRDLRARLGDTNPGAPVDLGPDLPLPANPVFGTPDAPKGTVEENPPMVYNPQTKRISRKKADPGPDPTRLEDLPTDLG